MSIGAWLVRDKLRVLALVAAALTLGAMASQLIGARGLTLANGQPIFGDFLAFWSAGRLALEDRASEIYSVQAIAAEHREALPDLRVVFPWRHPPPFLAIIAPFALLPFPVAATLFLAASGALFFLAARKIAPNDLVFAATAPAALLQLGSVQTGLLVAGLTGLAFHWLERRPLAAGACIGLMAIKPHLAILWPIFLIVQGRWRAFFSATATAILFILLAGALFGFELYPRFVAALAEAQRTVEFSRVAKDTLTSLYANLLGLGAPHSLALALHWLSAIAALVFAIAIWTAGPWPANKLVGAPLVGALCIGLTIRAPTRGAPTIGPGAGGPAMAAFVCATLLFSPYLFFYDEILILIAIAALYRGANAREQMWLAFAWASAGISLALGKFLTIPLCPIAAWALLVIAAMRSDVRLLGSAQAHSAQERRR